jgi:hypothetical protein
MSILIGLHIKRVLEQEEAVTRYVGNRIFPVVAPLGVEAFPFIGYDMTGGTGDSTKDGTTDDVASVRLSVVAKSYEEAILIGNAVGYAFEGKTAVYEEFAVTECANVTYNDEYIDDFGAYALDLNIDFRTEDY